ncbi:DUF1003 domain-containing protein [Candidatus Woesearchaeota archaeon]|nr:DUF1003 domain-containing protein [Candidatus Woesearchaeota archaeon]
MHIRKAQKYINEKNILPFMSKKNNKKESTKYVLQKEYRDDNHNEHYGNSNKRLPFYRHKLTLGQKAADSLAEFAGSWSFILLFSGILVIWMLINSYVLLVRPFDPYPFILLNLFLSCLAALQAPVILMSQNREVQRDRIQAKYDYQVNRKAEREIQDIQKDLELIKKILTK